jgi:hypothetical protein
MWDTDMPLLSNRFFLYDMGKVLLGSGLLFMAAYILIAAVTGNLKSLGPVMILLSLCLFVVLFLFVLIALLFFRNVYPVRYLIGTQGIGFEMLSRRGKIASRLAIVAGLLSGEPGEAGAGLLEWNDVRKIKAYPAFGVISVMNNWRVVVRIFCTPEYYPAVIAWLRWGAPKAEYRECGAPVPAITAEASAGSFGLESIRRLALVAGVCAYLWLGELRTRARPRFMPAHSRASMPATALVEDPTALRSLSICQHRTSRYGMVIFGLSGAIFVSLQGGT